MSKDFIVTEYTFSPGASSVGYVDLYNLNDFDITRVVSIINQTKGEIIYATGMSDKKYTSVSGRKVYLYYNTSSHSASDKLQIVYNTTNSSKSSDTDTQEMIKLLSRLVKIAENQQATDAGQRQRVTIDAGTLPTVTTVSTVTSATNVAAIASMGQEQYINIARNTYANSIRNKLFFS
jgi:hypothetical protein